MARKKGARGRKAEPRNEAVRVEGLNLDFSAAPTISRFLRDNSFVRGLVGPVGSGKSYACAAEVFLRALAQEPSPRDNIRYTRCAVIRNTYPELRTTVLKTWGEIFPENVFGNMRWSPPITHHIKLPAKDDIPGVDLEVIFLALDQPKDIRRLLSLELTFAWVSECRELPKAVIDGLTARVGRYPTKRDGGPTWRGVWMETNPCDSDHWFYILAEQSTLDGPFAWRFWRQPGGITEVAAEDKDAIEGGGKHWLVNPAAENLLNLPPGYYIQQLQGKKLDWVQCYAAGQYVYVSEGQPVWPEYSDTDMSISDLEPWPDVPIQIGMDFGLTPAAVFGQRLPNGRWQILSEVVAFDMGLQRFGASVQNELAVRFPRHKDALVWGDPAGLARDPIYERTAFDFLRTIGLRAQPTSTNDMKVRREAGAAPMIRRIPDDGKPGLLVDKRCARLRKALNGGFHFRRINVSGETERFRDVPNKNFHSHVADAFGYLMLGGGEFRRLTVPSSIGQPTRQISANLDFNVFG